MANYTSDYSISIDGVSSDTLGVWVSTLVPVPPAKQHYTTGFTGSDEPFSLPDDVYDPIKYTVTFFKFFPASLDDSAIRKYLSKGTLLQLSTLPALFFKILTIDYTISQTADNQRIEYNVTFTLKPFRYILDNDWITVTSGATIANNGTRYSKPLFWLANASGEVKLTVSGKEHKFKDLSGDIFIDSERHIIYDSNNQIVTGKDDGIYPLLAVGDNEISFTGTVTSVKVKLNRREI